MPAFPHLDSLIHIYFSQDYDLIADTMEGLVADFANSSSADDVSALRGDIALFLQQEDVAAAFEKAYWFDVDPKLWGHTTVSFLKKIDELLAQHQQEKRG